MRMRKWFKLAVLPSLAIWALLIAAIVQANAQSLVRPCYEVSGQPCQATSAATPLPVTLGSSGGGFIGYVGGYDFQLAPTVTVDAGAYATGDSVGGLITVTGAARTAGGSGILNGIRIKSAGGSTNTLWVYAWSKTPGATCTNNAAYVASAGDSAYSLVGFPTSVVLGGAPGAWDTATAAQLTALIANFKNQDTSPGTAIYICLVTAGAVTPASTSDITINLSGMQD